MYCKNSQLRPAPRLPKQVHTMILLKSFGLGVRVCVCVFTGLGCDLYIGSFSTNTKIHL
jgi:hypothetical protein